MLKVSPIPIFSDNYVWMIHAPGSNEVCIVDPGDAEPVINALKTHNLTLAKILITHSHPDHIGGIETLVNFAPVEVIGPDTPAIPQVTQTVSEGDQFKLFGAHIDIWHLPGHLPEHVAYIWHHQNDTQAFSGDIMFSSGCGRIFDGSHAELKSSLDRLKALPPSTLIYGAHEYTTGNITFAQAVEPDNQELGKRRSEVERLRASNQASLPVRLENEWQLNPFLRCDQASVARAAEKQLGHEPKNELEVFTAIRRWKDEF